MTVITPREVWDCQPDRWGRLLQFSGRPAPGGHTARFEGSDYTSWETARPLLDTVGSLGRTTSVPLPCSITQVERHQHTEEAQIPIAHPIVLLVGAPSENPPSAAELEGIILRPGWAFVLDRGVWHSASHGLTEVAPYLWQAWVYRNEPSIWANIPDGPVVLTTSDERNPS
jgi:ureidoglycolate hydrolase